MVRRQEWWEDEELRVGDGYGLAGKGVREGEGWKEKELLVQVREIEQISLVVQIRVYISRQGRHQTGRKLRRRGG